MEVTSSINYFTSSKKSQHQMSLTLSDPKRNPKHFLH